MDLVLKINHFDEEFCIVRVTLWKQTVTCSLSLSLSLSLSCFKYQAVAGLAADGRQIVARAKSEATNYQRFVFEQCVVASFIFTLKPA
jgi:hypothetical protein